MSNTPRLNLPEISSSQASKEITHNEALRVLDAIVQAVVINRTTSTPPGSPVNGDAYIVASGGTGAWSGKDDHYVMWDGAAWDDYSPFDHMFVMDIGAEEIIYWDAGGTPPQWVVFTVISGDFVDKYELTPAGSPLTITPVIALSNKEAFAYVAAISGSLVIANPTGSPSNFQKLVIRLKSASVQSLSYGTAYRSGGIPLPLNTTGSGKTDYLLFFYNTQDSTWDFSAYNPGF